MSSHRLQLQVPPGFLSYVLRTQGKCYVPSFTSGKSKTDSWISPSILIFLEFLIMPVPILVIILYVCKARAVLSKNLSPHLVWSATNLITKHEKSRRYETKQQFPLNE